MKQTINTFRNCQTEWNPDCYPDPEWWSSSVRDTRGGTWNKRLNSSREQQKGRTPKESVRKWVLMLCGKAREKESKTTRTVRKRGLKFQRRFFPSSCLHTTGLRWSSETDRAANGRRPRWRHLDQKLLQSLRSDLSLKQEGEFKRAKCWHRDRTGPLWTGAERICCWTSPQGEKQFLCYVFDFTLSVTKPYCKSGRANVFIHLYNLYVFLPHSVEFNLRLDFIKTDNSAKILHVF